MTDKEKTLKALWAEQPNEEARQKLADKCGISLSGFKKYMRKVSIPKTERMEKLSSGTGLSMEVIVRHFYDF